MVESQAVRNTNLGAVMNLAGDSNPFSLPPALLAEVEAMAGDERRPVADVVADALKRYMRESRWQRVLAAGQARAKALGFTENDVPRLIAEFREEKRQGC